MGEFDKVPDLYGKLSLLIKHKLYSDWSAIGAFFGDVRGKTVQGWGSDSGRQIRDHVPLKHQQKLRELFETSLPAVYGPAQLNALILGPTTRLDLAFKIREWKNLNDLIAEEGNGKSCELFLAQDASLGAIRFSRRPLPEPTFRVVRGRDFRLEFKSAFFGETVIALYCHGSTWSPCPAHSGGGSILIPGLDEDGEPSFMSEDDMPARYRFAVMQLRHPPPEFIVRAMLQEAVLDTLTLQDITGFYRLQKPTERRFFYADIDIVDKAG